jgi:hypothetical protein
MEPYYKGIWTENEYEHGYDYKNFKEPRHKFGKQIQKRKTMESLIQNASKFYQIIKENMEQKHPKTMEDNL